jgi:hypothetical protein
MPISMRISAFAIGMLGGVAIMPLPSYAVDDDDIEINTPGAIVEVERDRPGLLPRLRDRPDVYVETPGPDVYVEGDDDDDDDEPPAASVELDDD